MNTSNTKKQHSYPLVAGLGLSARDKHLLEYYLGSEAQKIDWRASNFLAAYLEQQKQGICYFPSADFSSLKEIAEWNIPTLAAARLGPELERADLFSFLLETGLCALWILPDHGKPVIFPRLSPLQSRQSVLLVEEQEERRRFFRQLYAFAGYDVRADCSSAQEILLCLKDSDLPMLLQLNLDHSAVNPTELIYAMGSLFKANPQQRHTLRILFIKDFNIPGFPFGSLEELLGSYARRIFSPKEAVFALIEAFFGRPRNPLSAADLLALDAILYGSPTDLTKLSPVEMTSGERFPFLWLYESMAKNMEKGLCFSYEGKTKSIKAG